MRRSDCQFLQAAPWYWMLYIAARCTVPEFSNHRNDIGSDGARMGVV